MIKLPGLDYKKIIIILINITWLALAVFIRWKQLNVLTGDTIDFLLPWYDFIVEHGGFHALGLPFSNYSPPYTYLLFISTLTHSFIPKLVAIKSISILFDFVAGYYMYRLVQLKYRQGLAPWLALFMVLFAPTVIINGSFWGQCDVIYTAFLLASLYYACTNRYAGSVGAFAIAFSLKSQAIFFAPVITILFLKKMIPWRYALVFPVVYFALLVPAWIAGRPLMDLLLIYFNQFDFYTSISLYAPNLYLAAPSLQEMDPFALNSLSLVLSGLTALVLVFIPLIGRAKINPGLLVVTTTISVVALPFFLPRMHERYFFPADIFTIALAFYYPAFFFLPAVYQVISVASYTPFLYGTEILPLSLVARVNLIALAGLFVGWLADWIPVPLIPLLKERLGIKWLGQGRP